jgi:hypothetical protein
VVNALKGLKALGLTLRIVANPTRRKYSSSASSVRNAARKKILWVTGGVEPTYTLPHLQALTDLLARRKSATG